MVRWTCWKFWKILEHRWWIGDGKQERAPEKRESTNMSSPWLDVGVTLCSVGAGRKRVEERLAKSERGSNGERAANWAVAGSGIQMGKTALCADAAGPVAGGVAADKYVSRQHHAAAYHAALAPSISVRFPEPSFPPPRGISLFPVPTVSRLCFTLAAHLNIMEMSTREIAAPGPRHTLHLSYTLMSSRGLPCRRTSDSTLPLSLSLSLSLSLTLSAVATAAAAAAAAAATGELWIYESSDSFSRGYTIGGVIGRWGLWIMRKEVIYCGNLTAKDVRMSENILIRLFSWLLCGFEYACYGRIESESISGQTIYVGNRSLYDRIEYE